MKKLPSLALCKIFRIRDLMKVKIGASVIFLFAIHLFHEYVYYQFSEVKVWSARRLTIATCSVGVFFILWYSSVLCPWPFYSNKQNYIYVVSCTIVIDGAHTLHLALL